VKRNGELVMPVRPAGILHGLRNHPRLHNPVTFQLDVPEPTEFVVTVGDVSAHGGAALSIKLDGKEKLRKDFVDANDPEKGGKLEQFRGNYSIPLPPGRHTVIVECVGKDWLMVNGYRAEQLVKPGKPLLRASGILGKNRGLVWVQNPQYTWSAPTKPDEVDGAIIVVNNIPKGRWTIEYFDSHKGKVTKTESKNVTSDGALKIDLPPTAWDAAFRLKR
jgi:hypothetical protein